MGEERSTKPKAQWKSYEAWAIIFKEKFGVPLTKDVVYRAMKMDAATGPSTKKRLKKA